jgi:hypothetical protein
MGYQAGFSPYKPLYPQGLWFGYSDFLLFICNTFMCISGRVRTPVVLKARCSRLSRMKSFDIFIIGITGL